MIRFVFVFFNIFLYIAAYACIYSVCQNTNRALLFSGIYLFSNSTIVATSLAAIAHWYSLTHMTFIIMGECLIFFTVVTLKGIWHNLTSIINLRFSILKIFLLLLISYLYLAHPTEYLDGGRDPGLNYYGALRISDTGGWQIPFDENAEDIYIKYESFLKDGYPGIYLAKEYGIGEHNSDLVPQFLPMLPSILAVGYDMGGIFLLNRMNGLFAILGLIVMYYYVYDVLRVPKCAIISTLLLALSPAYLWNAREPVSEILAFTIIMSALYIESFFSNYLLAGIISSFLFGFLCVERIDSPIIGIGLGLIWIYRLFCFNSQEIRKRTIYCYFIYMFSIICSIGYLYFFSYPYFKEHFFLMKYTIYANIILFSFFAIVLLFTHKRRVKFQALDFLLGKKYIVIFICYFLFCLTKYAYFIRPLQFPNDSWNRAMVEFCWYTSLFSVILAIIGLGGVLYNNKYLSLQMPFLFLGIMYMVIYIYSPSISLDHMWASRRWIIIQVPFIFIMASYAITNVFTFHRKRIKKGKINYLLIIPIIIYLLYQDTPFIGTTMMKNIHLQYNNLAKRLDNNITYFTDNGYIVGILKFVYHKKVYWVYRDKMEEYIVETEKPLYFIGNAEEGIIKYQCIDEYSIQYKYLEKTVAKYPRRIVDYEYITNIYRVQK